jgi:hypothetical protein
MSRRLRIAASLLLAALVVALWVRSYWYSESIVTTKTPTAWALGTIEGRLISGRFRQGIVNNRREWQLSRSPSRGESKIRSLSFGFDYSGNERSIAVPFWSILAAIAVCWLPASWPSVRLQFSLRALFITTTLIAILLGLFVWLAS